jgi:hypothetical protein
VATPHAVQSQVALSKFAVLGAIGTVDLGLVMVQGPDGHGNSDGEPGQLNLT